MDGIPKLVGAKVEELVEDGLAKVKGGKKEEKKGGGDGDGGEKKEEEGGSNVMDTVGNMAKGFGFLK